MALNYFDSHCHFDFDRFDADREDIWQRCLAQGVTGLLVPGIKPDQWARAQALSERFSGIFFSAGLHPWWLNEAGQNWVQALEEMLQQPDCVALGECGLDKMIDTPIVEQEALLEQLLQIAQRLQRPVILHCVRAHNELIRLLKRFPLARGGVVHAFSGSPEIARTYWDMGFHLGVGGTITYERAHKTREALRSMPLESLVLETDAPDMPLAGHQGERNSPEYIPLIAQALAELRSESLDVVAQQTTENTLRLFNLSNAGFKGRPADSAQRLSRPQ